MAITWTYDTAAHLLRRAGFGHNGMYNKSTNEAKQVRTYFNMGQANAVAALLKIPLSRARGPGGFNGGDDNFAKLERWWVNRMRTTAKPLREKMVLFLHTHFATARSKVDRPLYMSTQNALFREFAIGDFRELVKRATVDAAMLWWLDGDLNVAGKPNENYGRELQELFTLGVLDFKGQRNYAQKDVSTAARILTGWHFGETKTKILVTFNQNDHDVDDMGNPKTMYATDPVETPNQNVGKTNQFTVDPNATPAEVEYQLLVQKIFDHLDTEGRPTVARYIARKMWKFFAYDPVVDFGTARTDLSMIDSLADTFKASNYSLAALLQAMFTRDEFYVSPASTPNVDATRTVKNPTEYVVSSLRMLNGKLSGDELKNVGIDTINNMGQELFNPPNVFSWRGNLWWITTQTLLNRYEFARDFAGGDKSRHSQLGFNVYSYIDKTETTRQAVVDRFLKVLGPLTVDTTTNDQLRDWLGATDPISLTDDNYVQTYVRGLVNLILTLPHYHVH